MKYFRVPTFNFLSGFNPIAFSSLEPSTNKLKFADSSIIKYQVPPVPQAAHRAEIITVLASPDVSFLIY
jgi:hypothetical protein